MNILPFLREHLSRKTFIMCITMSELFFILTHRRNFGIKTINVLEAKGGTRDVQRGRGVKLNPPPPIINPSPKRGSLLALPIKIAICLALAVSFFPRPVYAEDLCVVTCLLAVEHERIQGRGTWPMNLQKFL